MKMVDRESTKLPTKTPKLAITSLLLKIFVSERKWGFDKMGTFDQNPCLFGENGYPFYQEHTVGGTADALNFVFIHVAREMRAHKLVDLL